MKGNAKVLDALNLALAGELTAINQYIVHGEMCEHWGYKTLQAATRMNSIQEMKHAERLIERILFLEGAPSMAPKALNIGPGVKEQFKSDLALEQAAVKEYNESIKVCTQAGDNASRDLFLGLLKDEEGHVEYLEKQLSLIEDMGYETYLSVQLG